MSMKLNKITIFTIFFISTLLVSSCNNNSQHDKQNVDIIDSTNTAVKKEVVKKEFGIETSDYNITNDKIKSGETFSIILSHQGLKYETILKAVETSKDIFNVRSLRQGKKYYCFHRKDTTNTLDYFIYQKSDIEYIKFNFTDSISVTEHKLPIKIDTAIAEGEINSSLWISMKNAGIDPMLAMELSDIYAWTIDFYGLQKGDKYKVIYEKRFIDTNYVGIGKVLACQFTNNNHNYKAYLFSQDSLEDYFDEEGGSLRRAFLKAPLRYSRISSRFSNSRLHPILKIRRPHHGVDYAAPTGTPVHTIGDGRVTFKGRKGGYGSRIEIKHNGTYSTGYAHLSKFAKGLKKGDFVKQGTVIGYVGMTGSATGPHLDFRVYKNGTPIDPLKMKSPPAIPINKENKVNYDARMKFYNSLFLKVKKTRD